jgi:hypothetical protein
MSTLLGHNKTSGANLTAAAFTTTFNAGVVEHVGLSIFAKYIHVEDNIFVFKHAPSYLWHCNSLS